MAILNKPVDYFHMLVEATEQSCKAAESLEELVLTMDNLETRLHALHEIEHHADGLLHDLCAELNRAFITPLEREDILEIASAIDDITDQVEDTGIHIWMTNIKGTRPDMVEFVRIVRQCCDELLSGIKEFRNYKRSKTINDHIIEVNRLEEVGDRLYQKAVRNLYLTETDPLEIYKWREVYNDLEECCDAIELVADLMESAMMKNS
ncbi:MAG: DUF47 family protein [Clostridiaceae bacterium]|nr:DUF47 family protein [Clostridiaceae bacterium]